MASNFFRGISRWWPAKVVLSLIAILYAVYSLVAGPFTPALELPLLPGQILIVSGAALHLWHYKILKQEVPAPGNPARLVTGKGLFRFIRHPMYLGDAIMVLGATLMSGELLSLLLMAAFLPAVFFLARDEDRMMAEAFGKEFAAWRSRTRLLF